MNSLRDRLIGRYASIQQGRTSWDQTAVDRWARAQMWYLRGWLPADPHSVIADIGCGSGWLINALMRSGASDVSGVDCSPEQVALARRGTPAAQISDGDAAAFLAQRPDCFDLLFAMDVIEHMPRDDALVFLDRAKAALRPGGALIVQTLNAASPFAGEIRYGDPTHDHAYTPHSIRTMLALAGFTDVEIREQGPVPWGYSLASTLRWLVWRLARAALQIVSFAETGHADPVQTRTMLVRALRVSESLAR